MFLTRLFAVVGAALLLSTASVGAALAQDKPVPLLICGADGGKDAYQLIGRSGSLNDLLPPRHAALFARVRDLQLTVSPQLVNAGAHAAYCFSELVPMGVEPLGDYYRSEPKMGFNQCGRDQIQRTPLETSYEVATSGTSVIKVLLASGARRPTEKTFDCRPAAATELKDISVTIASVFSGDALELRVPLP